MAKPNFQIWQNKPKLNDSGQYVQVEVSDYYSVGFDTDLTDDDLYTNFTDIGRGEGSDINQELYFEQDSIDLNDHIYGVGQFRIEKIYLKLMEIDGTNKNNHNNTNIYVSFLDSAFFQCPPDGGPGCDLLIDGKTPQDHVNPETGQFGDGVDEEDVYKNFGTGDGEFNHRRRIYRIYGGSNFDCKWGKKDEMDFSESFFNIVGEEIKANENLNYWPDNSNPQTDTGGDTTSDPPETDSGLWRWNFFPYVNHPNITATNRYGFINPYFTNGGEYYDEYDTIVNADVFSNVTDTTWGGDSNNQYTHDYEDGAFYLTVWTNGDRCHVWEAGDYSTDPTMRVYAIPKKYIYDNWNGYKPICFKWGSNSGVDCQSGDIEYDMPYSPMIIKDWEDTDEDYDVLQAKDVRIRVIPPRLFYDSYISDLINNPPEHTPSTDNIQDFRPVNNTDDVVGKKNPIEKDPRNGYLDASTSQYFAQLTNCIFPGEILDDGNQCTTSAFYPYVYDAVPYLFQPTTDIDYRGNLVGITDGTLNQTRTDGVITSWSQVPSTDQLKNITLDTDYIRQRNFSAISYAWVGEDIDSGITVQRGYEPNSTEESQTSAPNFVNFWMTPTNSLVTNGVLDDEDFIDLTDETWDNDIYLGTGMGYKWCVARWGDEPDINDDDIDNTILNELESWQYSPSNFFQENILGRYNWVNVKDDSGLGIQTHQYQSEGPKTIKVLMFSYIKNTDQSDAFNRVFNTDGIVPYQTIHWKLVTIRILLNQSAAMVEDFSEIGGNDFTYIPMNTVSPIIGGLHKNSDYVKSVSTIYSANLFAPSEVLERIRTKKAFNSDSFGYFPGNMDIEQVRMFNHPYDMNYLLGIGNQVAVTNNRFRPHYFKSYWDGFENSFSNETSVGEIFIDDNVDVNLKSSCVLELNTAVLYGNKILDSSGNGNIGILLGDYSLEKTEKLSPIVRKQSMKTPQVDSENGAI